MDSSQDIELTGTRTNRTCKYRAEQPCVQPLLKCEACPHYLPETHDGLKKESILEKASEKLSELCPYVKLKGPLKEPAVEIGIKGTF